MPADNYLIDSFAHMPHTIPGATAASAGVMTAAQVQKLNSIVGGVGYNVTSYGAKGDAVQGSDGAMVTGSSTFSSASSTFTAADVGKQIRVENAGVGNPSALLTTIATFVDVHTVTLTSPNASGTDLTNVKFCYGTNDAPAWQAAIDALLASDTKSGVIYAPAPKSGYLLASEIVGTNGNVIRFVGEGSKIVVGLDVNVQSVFSFGNLSIFTMDGFVFVSDIPVIGVGSRPATVLSCGADNVHVSHCSFLNVLATAGGFSLGGINNRLSNCVIFGGNIGNGDPTFQTGIILLTSQGGVVDSLVCIDGSVNGTAAWVCCKPVAPPVPTFDAAGQMPYTFRNCSFDEVGGSSHVLMVPAPGVRASRVEFIDCQGLGNPGVAPYIINNTDDVLFDNCALVTRTVTSAIQVFGVARTTIRRLRWQTPDPVNVSFCIIDADAACGLVEVIDSDYSTVNSAATTTMISKAGQVSYMSPAANLAAGLLLKPDVANAGQFVVAAKTDPASSVVGVSIAGTGFASTTLVVPPPASMVSPAYFYLLTAKNGQSGALTEWRGDGGPFLGPPWTPINWQGAVDAAAIATIAAGVIAGLNNPGVLDITASANGANLIISSTVEGAGYDRPVTFSTPPFALSTAPLAGGSSHIQAGFIFGQTYQVKIDGTTAIAIGDKLTLSTTTDGETKKATVGAFLGIALSASAATAGALVTMIYTPGTI